MHYIGHLGLPCSFINSQLHYVIKYSVLVNSILNFDVVNSSML